MILFLLCKLLLTQYKGSRVFSEDIECGGYKWWDLGSRRALLSHDGRLTERIHCLPKSFISFAKPQGILSLPPCFALLIVFYLFLWYVQNLGSKLVVWNRNIIRPLWFIRSRRRGIHSCSENGQQVWKGKWNLFQVGHNL